MALSERHVRDEWINRVLGINVAELRSRGEGDAAAAVMAQDANIAGVGGQALWRAAREAVDAALDGLVQRLRSTGETSLERIAEDIPTFGRERDAALENALQAYEQAPPEGRRNTVSAVLAAARDYRAALGREVGYRLIDDNPFGVEVAMRASLDQALTQIEHSMAAAAA